MADYVCIAQQGQTPEKKQAELSAGLKNIAVEQLGQATDEVEVRWLSVNEGFGFTAGLPSTATLVARSVPVGFPQDERVQLMTRICDLWQEVTGCSTNEIVVTVLDGALPI